MFASLGTIHEEKASLLVKFISFWLLGRNDVSQQKGGGESKMTSMKTLLTPLDEGAFPSLLEKRGLVRILATTSV